MTKSLDDCADCEGMVAQEYLHRPRLGLGARARARVGVGARVRVGVGVRVWARPTLSLGLPVTCMSSGSLLIVLPMRRRSTSR